MEQGTIWDIMIPVGWPWATVTIVWKFVLMKKHTLAPQEYLERSLNQEYYHTEWPQKLFVIFDKKIGPWNWFKWSTWQRFFRIKKKNIRGKPFKKSCIQETMTLSTCADRRTKKIFLDIFIIAHLSFFLLHLLVFLHTVALEGLCAIARTNWSTVV